MINNILKWENEQVLNLIQATLGSITNNMRVIALECHNEKHVLIYFLLEKDTPEDREEIEDIVFEFEALQDSFINDEIKIEVSSKFIGDLYIPKRKIYIRYDNR